MIQRILILIFVTSCISVAALKQDLAYFTAKSDGKAAVILEWKSANENAVTRYDVERAGGEDQDFKFIATITPKGVNTPYQYIDADAFMRNAAPAENQKAAVVTYRYRLKIISKGTDPVYSNTATVSHNISSVRRTWGMIKEMFR